MLRFKELEEIVKRWETIGLIENFVEKTPIALCLHAQVKLNEKVDLDPAFRRWSIPLIVRMFSESKAFKRNHFTNLFDEQDKPTIAFLRTKFIAPQPPNRTADLQYEAELVAKMAVALKEEIDYLFRDRKGATITFHGISHTPQGDLILHYS